MPNTDELANYITSRPESVPPNEHSGGIQPPIPNPSPNARNMKFPSFRSVLWDRTPRGQATVVDAERYLPCVEIPVSTIDALTNSLAQSPKTDAQVLMTLSGSLQCSPGGLRMTLDASDGDVEVFHGTEFTAGMYAAFVKGAMRRIGSRDALAYNNYVTTKLCVALAGTGILSLYGEHLAPALSLTFCEINPLRLVSTPFALSLQKQTLAAPFDSGYLTLDQYRNAVPLLDNDAVAFNSPLVGAWVYGKCSVQDLRVWMSCVRFLYNSSIKDRVTVAAMSFLLAFFDTSSGNTAVRFYECTANHKGSRLCHHQFGAEAKLHLTTPLKLPWHPVTDEVAVYRFTQAEQGRISPTLLSRSRTEAPKPVVAVPDRCESPLQVSQGLVPSPRPLPAFSPCPRPCSSPLSSSAPTYPYWRSPDAFYGSVPAQVPTQAEFQNLQAQLRELQRKFDAHFSQQLRVEAATNTSQRSIRLFHCQATSTNDLAGGLHCRDSASDEGNTSSSNEQSSYDAVAPTTAELGQPDISSSDVVDASATKLAPHSLSRSQLNGAISPNSSRSVSQSPAKSLSSESKLSDVEPENCGSRSAVCEQTSPSSSSSVVKASFGSSSGRMSIEELSVAPDADDALFDIPRIEFTPDDPHCESSDDDDERIAKRYFQRNELDNGTLSSRHSSTSLLMRVQYDD